MELLCLIKFRFLQLINSIIISLWAEWISLKYSNVLGIFFFSFPLCVNLSVALRLTLFRRHGWLSGKLLIDSNLTIRSLLAHRRWWQKLPLFLLEAWEASAGSKAQHVLGWVASLTLHIGKFYQGFEGDAPLLNCVHVASFILLNSERLIIV